MHALQSDINDLLKNQNKVESKFFNEEEKFQPEQLIFPLNKSALESLKFNDEKYQVLAKNLIAFSNEEGSEILKEKIQNGKFDELF